MNDNIPSYENIRDMLPAILATPSEKCPLCGRQGMHQHTPEEIVIYRNGVKYGRSLVPVDGLEELRRPVICPVSQGTCYRRSCAEECQIQCPEGNTFFAIAATREQSKPDFSAIVPGEAKDDGAGRKSAYDTTWPDVHSGRDSNG